MGRTTGIFELNLTALTKAEAVVAVCDGPQVDDGTAWEIGYAYGRNMQVYGLRTDTRVGQQPDERINLMILESLSELSSTVEQLVHTLRYTERPGLSPVSSACCLTAERSFGARPRGITKEIGDG